MTAAALVRSAVAAGMRIRANGDNLVLSGPVRPDAHVLQALRAVKPEVLDYLKGLALWDEDDWAAPYDERAGIMEFDGGLSRAESEARAKEEVKSLRGLVEDIGDD